MVGSETTIGWAIAVMLMVAAAALGCEDDSGGGAATSVGGGASGGSGSAGGAVGGGGTGTGEPCADHCDNGVQDCDELWIDCGGSCAACGPALEVNGRWLGVRGTDGSWKVAIGSGTLFSVAFYQAVGDEFDAIVADGKNLVFLWAGAGAAEGPDQLPMYVGHDFDGGFDEAHWSTLLDFVDDATDRGLGVLVALFATVALEYEAGARWDRNVWNASYGHGGPYDLTVNCGKDAFYSFGSYGTPIYTPGDDYPASADTLVRGQWRQEEIVHRAATELAGRRNVAIYLMWEGYDLSAGLPGSGGQCETTADKQQGWHDHMAGFIRSVGGPMLVTTMDTDLRQMSALDFGVIESSHRRTWAVNNADIVTWPVVTTGFSPGGGTADIASIREGWLHGIQQGPPFWEYRSNLCPDCAPPTQYVRDLRPILDTITTWDDEPGDELTDASLP
ncbi:MAG: hypothetical protein JRI23_21285 [Deltaproteobacteria bacterium]|nr:hypothetical protein [Deltaproteobacteria bacterium]MBW2534477.1 hypothetical protein [Deltaproteobacteria bacterium]